MEAAPAASMRGALGPGAEGGNEAGRTHAFDGVDGPEHGPEQGKRRARKKGPRIDPRGSRPVRPRTSRTLNDPTSSRPPCLTGRFQTMTSRWRAANLDRAWLPASPSFPAMFVR